jgi:hypothetical protein
VIESGLKPAQAIALVEVDGGPKLTSSDLSRALSVAIKAAADEWERSEMEMESQDEGGRGMKEIRLKIQPQTMLLWSCHPHWRMAIDR